MTEADSVSRSTREHLRRKVETVWFYSREKTRYIRRTLSYVRVRICTYRCVSVRAYFRAGTIVMHQHCVPRKVVNCTDRRRCSAAAASSNYVESVMCNSD